MTHYEKRNFQKIVVSLLGSSLLGYRAFFIIAGVLLFFAWLPDGMSSLLDKIFGGEILNYLFAASNIFVSGVATALFFAIIFRGKIDKDLVLCAMCLGGALGLAAAISGINAFAVAGIVAACILCLAARFKFNVASSKPDPNCVCIPQTSECEEK